jgi:hypothetical protein
MGCCGNDKAVEVKNVIPLKQAETYTKNNENNVDRGNRFPYNEEKENLNQQNFNINSYKKEVIIQNGEVQQNNQVFSYNNQNNKNIQINIRKNNNGQVVTYNYQANNNPQNNNNMGGFDMEAFNKHMEVFNNDFFKGKKNKFNKGVNVNITNNRKKNKNISVNINNDVINIVNNINDVVNNHDVFNNHDEFNDNDVFDNDSFFNNNNVFNNNNEFNNNLSKEELERREKERKKQEKKYQEMMEQRRKEQEKREQERREQEKKEQERREQERREQEKRDKEREEKEMAEEKSLNEQQKKENDEKKILEDEKTGEQIKSVNTSIPADTQKYLTITVNKKNNNVFIPKYFDLTRFQRDGLKRHNYYRKHHQVGPMYLTAKLNEYSQKYAETLAQKNVMQHSTHDQLEKIYGDWTGENLYTYWTSVSNLTLTGADAVDSWYSEIFDYDFKKCDTKNGKAIGHFTQLVWKGSTQLGIGVAKNKQNNVYVVANYHKGGNVVGNYPQNVFVAK